MSLKQNNRRKSKLTDKDVLKHPFMSGEHPDKRLLPNYCEVWSFEMECDILALSSIPVC